MGWLSLFLLLFAVPVTAQTASYGYLDQRRPYANPSPPFLRALSTPGIGQRLRLEVAYSWRQRNRTGTDYFLATGLASPAVVVPGLGGVLFTSAEIVIPTPMSPLGIPGRAVVSFAVPNSTQLLGVRFFQQVLEVPFLPAGPPRLGRGGVGVIGR